MPVIAEIIELREEHEDHAVDEVHDAVEDLHEIHEVHDHELRTDPTFHLEAPSPEPPVVELDDIIEEIEIDLVDPDPAVVPAVRRKGGAKRVIPPASERSEARPARAPPSRSVYAEPRDTEPRKVIVEPDPDHVLLLDCIRRGGRLGEEAARELAVVGLPALPAIMMRFPGPTPIDFQSLKQLPSPEQAGPLIAAVASIGKDALGSILFHTRDPSVHVRFWATYLLTVLVAAESAQAVAERLMDDERPVRRMAMAAARTLMRDRTAPVGALAAPLLELMLDPSVLSPRRGQAARALGSLRLKRAVPSLISVLGQPEIRPMAEHALRAITRLDPHASGHTWQSWHAAFGGHSRVEWLIQALLGEDLKLRTEAAEELKELTGSTYGYLPHLPLSDRERAWRRYLEWWEGIGRKHYAGWGWDG